MPASPLITHRSQHLDGIRGFAVLIVFLSHSAGRKLYCSDYLQLQGIGHIGVYLFFALSSWLLTSIVLRELASTGQIGLRAYFLRRLFRIAPLYFCVVTAVFAVQSITGLASPEYLHVDGGVSGYLRHLVFLKGDSLFWTIPCEVSFYLLLPFLAYLLAKWPKVVLPLLAITAASFAFQTVTLDQQPEPHASWVKLVDIAHPTQFIEVFLIGMLGAWLAHQTKGKALGKTWLPMVLQVAVALAVSATLFYLCAITCDHFLWYRRTDYTFRTNSWLFAVLFTSLIFVVEKVPDGWLAKFFCSRLLCLMGILGFSWYLLHFPVFQLINLCRAHLGGSFPGADAIYFIIAWLSCAAVSWTSYQVIEKPGMALGRRLEARGDS